jgi:hypothetical protein
MVSDIMAGLFKKYEKLCHEVEAKCTDNGLDLQALCDKVEHRVKNELTGGQPVSSVLAGPLNFILHEVLHVTIDPQFTLEGISDSDKQRGKTSLHDADFNEFFIRDRNDTFDENTFFDHTYSDDLDTDVTGKYRKQKVKNVYRDKEKNLKGDHVIEYVALHDDAISREVE